MTGTFDQNGLRVGPAPRLWHRWACPFRPYILLSDESADTSITTESGGHSAVDVEPSQAKIKTEPETDDSQATTSTTSDMEGDNMAIEDPDWSEEEETDETYDASPKRAKWG